MPAVIHIQVIHLIDSFPTNAESKRIRSTWRQIVAVIVQHILEYFNRTAVDNQLIDNLHNIADSIPHGDGSTIGFRSPVYPIGCDELIIIDFPDAVGPLRQIVDHIGEGITEVQFHTAHRRHIIDFHNILVAIRRADQRTVCLLDEFCDFQLSIAAALGVDDADIVRITADLHRSSGAFLRIIYNIRHLIAARLLFRNLIGSRCQITQCGLPAVAFLQNDACLHSRTAYRNNKALGIIRQNELSAGVADKL